MGWYVQFTTGTDLWWPWDIEAYSLMDAYEIVKGNPCMRLVWRDDGAYQ